MAATSAKSPSPDLMMKPIDPIMRVAAWLLLAHGALWLLLLLRWLTFGAIDWDPFGFENALARTCADTCRGCFHCLPAYKNG